MSDTSRSTDDAVLRVDDLHVNYRAGATDVHAVRGVSFTVRAGERVGVVGESGSGKSSIAMAMLGLIEKPSQVRGSVRLNGRELTGASDKQMNAVRGREIGLIYQDPMSALDPLRPIGAQIVEAIKAHRRDLSRSELHDAAVALLAAVDVANPQQRYRDYPHEYSGGMRQRVAIAMAIANDPTVLIADEPTTALDVTTQASIMHLLQRLVVDQHSAMVLITHNLGLVAEYCERVMVVYGGRIVESGDVDHVFADPQHPYTAALLASVPRPGQMSDEPLAYIEGLPPNLRVEPPGCSFAPRCTARLLLDDPQICSTVMPPLVVRGGQSAECHLAAVHVGGGVRD